MRYAILLASFIALIALACGGGEEAQPNSHACDDGHGPSAFTITRGRR